MGAYQMAKGAHYLSHTVITALFAWLVSAIFISYAKWEEEYDELWSRLRRSIPPYNT